MESHHHKVKVIMRFSLMFFGGMDEMDRMDEMDGMDGYGGMGVRSAARRLGGSGCPAAGGVGLFDIDIDFEEWQSAGTP